jgi:hypothetical protein
MKGLWKELIGCGYKSVGTPEKLKAEELLFAALKDISPGAYKMEFTFEGWGTSGGNVLVMDHPSKKQFDCEVFLGSGSGEFSGELGYIGKNIVCEHV